MLLAAVGDIHYSKRCAGKLRRAFATAGEEADVLVLCGDLTDYGQPEEAEVLAEDLSVASIPKVAVLGNHDYESDHPETMMAILREAGVQILDGEGLVVEGVGFVGTKGFGGGFGRYSLEPWGESVVKEFVKTAVDEALKLEQALARLRNVDRRVAVLHYAPILDTVMGEPEPILPFLGSTRLEEPLDRFSVRFALHGHAHGGRPEGRTRGGIPVYNVALPVLRRMDEPRSYRLLEV